MKTLTRPWGKMWLLADHPGWWIKLIRVNKYERTSLQLHKRRKELHIGLSRWFWQYVPLMGIHDLRAGLYLEFAWGNVFETDIIRLQDKYGRV